MNRHINTVDLNLVVLSEFQMMQIGFRRLFHDFKRLRSVNLEEKFVHDPLPLDVHAHRIDIIRQRGSQPVGPVLIFAFTDQNTVRKHLSLIVAQDRMS